MSDELEKVKKHFVEEYRANGGQADTKDWDISLLMNEVKHLKEKNELTRQIEALRKGEKDEIKSFTINPVNHARENAALAQQLGATVREALNYYDPLPDPRIVDDESFERDNNLIKLAEPGTEASVCILRDNAGRCDMGGPTKWRDGSLDEKERWI